MALRKYSENNSQKPAEHTVFEGPTVGSVLADYDKGDRSSYKNLLERLPDPTIREAELSHWLQHLQGCVSQLTNEHEALVRAILRVDWVHRDQKIKGEYQVLLVNLVSAQPIYLTRILTTLVRHFSPENPVPSAGVCELHDVDPSHHKKQEAIFAAIHSILQELQKVVPSLPKYVLSVLGDNMPHSKHSGYVQEWYILNLLQLSQYLPELQQGILEIIIHRLLELDVSIPKDEVWEDEAEQNAEGMADTQFTMDGLNDGEKDCSVEEEESLRLTETAAKLDTMMMVMMDYLKQTCFRNDEFLLDEAKVLHRRLVQIFERVILPTHASSHVQFLLFYFCSFRQGIVDSFLDSLWKKFINPNTPAIVRQTTASYIASFIARADYLPMSTVTACLDLVMGWIHCYIDNQEGALRCIQDVNIHGPFYSLCQAVLYIFVYRHKQLLENNKGLHYIMSLNLERMVTCRLNPLRVSLPSIVSIFATLARKFQVAFCYTVMEHNARSTLPIIKVHSNSSVSKMTHNNPLDSFFPYDPYLLPESGQNIEKLYRHWEGCKPDFSGLSQKEEDEEDEFMQYECADKDLPLGLTPTSMACISPGFRTPSLDR